ncbi:MAG: DUF3267 domain-containing protein [Ktedonobacteraceae bacterium]|nr:DUF3267 domain-containing protein [Ktedonobacteraceae bacterium]
MSLTYIDRFHPRQRRERQAALEHGRLRKYDELELLNQEQLRPLALLSLLLLVLGVILFGGLNLFAYFWQTHALPQVTLWGALLWFLVNMLGYIIILPVHELIHGLVFLLWGGRPYFGAKLPLALYCGARNQLFRRNYYLTVGLAPLLVLTLASIIFTVLVPSLAFYTLFASIGNFAGAAGDIWVAVRLQRLPGDVLVEDTNSGYRAWRIEDSTQA